MGYQIKTCPIYKLVFNGFWVDGLGVVESICNGCF